jgi:hypothetical protein
MVGTFSGMTTFSGQFQTVSSCCCTGNATRGIYFAWRDIVTMKNGTLRVNLLLNRASQWADVNSFLPFKGRVDVIVKKNERLMVRIPSWVTDPKTVSCTVSGTRRSCGWEGRYLNVGAVKAGQTVTVQFPQTDDTVRTKICWYDKGNPQEKQYTVRVRGFNVVDIWPKESVIFPFYTNGAHRGDRVVWRRVERFAPAVEGYW